MKVFYQAEMTRRHRMSPSQWIMLGFENRREADMRQIEIVLGGQINVVYAVPLDELTKVVAETRNPQWPHGGSHSW